MSRPMAWLFNVVVFMLLTRFCIEPGWARDDSEAGNNQYHLASNEGGVEQILKQAVGNAVLRALQNGNSRQEQGSSPAAGGNSNRTAVTPLGFDGRDIRNTKGYVGCQVMAFHTNSLVQKRNVELEDVIFALDHQRIDGCTDLAKRLTGLERAKSVLVHVSGLRRRTEFAIQVEPLVVGERQQEIAASAPLTASVGSETALATTETAAMSRPQSVEATAAERKHLENEERQKMAKQEAAQRERTNAERRAQELVKQQRREQERQEELNRQMEAKQQEEQTRLAEQQRQSELTQQQEAQMLEQQRLADQQQAAIRQQRAEDERRQLIYMTAILGAPLLIGLVIYLGRIRKVASLVERFNHWLSGKRESMRANRNAHGWMKRVMVSALFLLMSWTRPIKDPYLMAGTQVAVYTYFIGAVVYAAIVVTAVVLMIAMGLFFWWVVIRMFAREAGIKVGESRVRNGFFGKYTEHFDGDGNRIGESRQKDGFFGKYTERTDADGNKIGESRKRDGFFSDYTEYTDADGNKTGESRERDGLLGEYTEHTDADGNKVGESRKKDGFFGTYTEHTGAG